MTTTARFLHNNGYELEAGKDEFVAFPLKVENTHLDIEEIAKWLKEHTRKLHKSY